jgi:hypothetical protein
MQNVEDGNVRHWDEEAEGEGVGPQGLWKILRVGETDEGEPVFSMNTMQWPNWFMYVQNNSEGNVRGWKGDAGHPGHFIFTKWEGDPEPEEVVEELVPEPARIVIRVAYYGR